MANYTSEEVQTAVEKIVRASVRSTTGPLGERQVSDTFSDLQEAASGVYILYYNAPFYTLYLGTTRLQDAAQTQGQTLMSLIDAVNALGRIVTPVRDISPIANSGAALLELEAAVASRKGGFSDISKVPAFRRYAQGLSEFVSSAGPNLKGITLDMDPESPTYGRSVPGIVDTPAGARSNIPGLVTQLREQRDELVRRAELLAHAMEDFASLQLPQVAAQGVISRARQVLDETYDKLAGMSEDARLEVLRSVLLDLLTQRPLVEQYGAALGPSEFITTKGMATAYSDGTHPASSAAVDSNIFGPYDLTEANHFVRFIVDGAAPVDLPLPVGYIAKISSIRNGPYQLEVGVSDQLVVTFGNPDAPTGLVTFYLTLPAGSFTSSAQEIADAANAQISGFDLRFVAEFSPLKYQSLMAVLDLSGEQLHGPYFARFAILGGSLNGLNIQVDDEIDVLSGPNAGSTWYITYVDAGGGYVDALSSMQATTVGLPDGVLVKIGDPNRTLALVDSNPTLSLDIRRAVQIPVTNGVSDKTAALLGFYPGTLARSRPVAAKDVANYIASSAPTLSASVFFGQDAYNGLARSSTTDAGRIVLAKGQWTGSMGAGTTVDFQAEGVIGSILVGDRLVIRSTVTSADLNREGAVTQVIGNTVRVAFDHSVSGGSVEVEVGPNLSNVGFGSVIYITSGPNQGRYTVRSDKGVGVDCSFEFLLEASLPVAADGTKPVYFTANMGKEGVRFKSRSTGLDSSISVDNPPSGTGASAFFYTPLPAVGKGTTPYLAFDSFPSGASVGDAVLFYEQDYLSVSRQFSITGLEQGFSLVKLDPEMAIDTSMDFSMDAMAPFGRIRVAKVANYGVLRDRLTAWLALPAQQEAYFQRLYSVLNPLLVNRNPTPAQVHDAVALLKEMLATMTLVGATYLGTDAARTIEYALAEYKAPAEEPVDTLLSTLRNKGVDRGIDLLLEGQFSAFFNLSMDGMSYSGTLLAGLREMAREDLPVRKLDRGFATQKMIGSSPTQEDSEYTADDADPSVQPDAPVAPDIITPNSSY